MPVAVIGSGSCWAACPAMAPEIFGRAEQPIPSASTAGGYPGAMGETANAGVGRQEAGCVRGARHGRFAAASRVRARVTVGAENVLAGAAGLLLASGRTLRGCEEVGRRCKHDLRPGLVRRRSVR